MPPHRAPANLAATAPLAALLVFVVLVAALPASAEDAPDPGKDAALAVARSAAAELSTEIRGLLMQELARGGVEEAVRICARAAQEKTAEFRARSGHDIRRVSLRPRNPMNAPDDLERRVLESFDRLPRSQVAAAEHVEVVATPDGTALRYLRPLVTAPLCLQCHGQAGEIPSMVRKILEKEYPGDRATGFAIGDVRGAISVRVPIPRQ